MILEGWWLLLPQLATSSTGLLLPQLATSSTGLLPRAIIVLGHYCPGPLLPRAIIAPGHYCPGPLLSWAIIALGHYFPGPLLPWAIIVMGDYCPGPLPHVYLPLNRCGRYAHINMHHITPHISTVLISEKMHVSDEIVQSFCLICYKYLYSNYKYTCAPST